MNLKKIGEALKGVAPTIAGTLLTGNPATGAALGGIIGDMLGVGKDDREASSKIVAKLADPIEFERIRAQLEQMEFTHKEEMARIGLEYHRVDAETHRDNYGQAQESYRTELSTTDDFVRRTRPLLVRCVFGLVSGMISFLIAAAIADYLTDQKLIQYCIDNSIELMSCTTNRETYLKQVSAAYSDNWTWLALVVGILPGYFGSRGMEKIKNRDDTER